MRENIELEISESARHFHRLRRSWHRMDAGAGFDLLPTDALLAICLGGSADRARDEAARLSARFDLADLCRATPAHIRLAAQIPRSRSVRLAAAFALGRRVETEARRPRPSLRSPSEVHGLLAPEVRGAAQETFHALLLDGKHRLRRREQVSLGTLNSSLVHPREVFGPALREGAAALIVAHNHPSGDPEPSDEDLAVTRRLVEAGRILGVPLLDHVVIGERSFVSIRERIRFEGG